MPKASKTSGLNWQPIFKSTKDWLSQLQKMQHNTPFKAIDIGLVQSNVQQLKELLPQVDIHYAVKSNCNLQLINATKDMVAGYEIASVGEFERLQTLGINSERVLYSNPVKVPSHIKATYEAGVRYYAFDSFNEIDKIAEFAPDANVYIRIKVEDIGSKFPLSKKFGVGPESVPDYMQAAAKAGLNPVGLTFHVGSQSENPLAWVNAFKTSSKIINTLAKQNIKLEMLDIGGGIPATYSGKPLDIRGITNAINDSIKRFVPTGVRVIAEPGRSVSATSSVIVATVIGRETRGSEEWLFLDMGVFQGLVEPLEIPSWRYPIFTDYKNPKALKKFVLTGPTCDPYDTIGSDYELPAKIKMGDRIYFGSAGAYTGVYGSNFNGFAPPNIYLVTEG